jgi:hypothetical protein
MILWSLLFACAGGEAPAPAAPPPSHPSPVVEEPAREPIPEQGAFSRELAPGLTLAAYELPAVADPGFSKPEGDLSGCDPRLFVVTIDPAKYRLDYTHGQGRSGTGPEWAEHTGAHVVFNPGMFEPDGKGTGYSRGPDFVSQPEVRRQAMYRGWFVAEPVGDAPAARVIDIVPPKGEGKYGAFDELPAETRAQLDGYAVVTQSLAIVRNGQAVYPPRKNQWSELAFGADDRGRVVVVFSRWPYEMREFGARVAALKLGITDLIHGEGGPEATLALRVDGLEWVAVGSYETGFFDDSNDVAWRLPAVFAAVPR